MLSPFFGLLLVLVAGVQTTTGVPFNAQGEMTGEVTAHSAILQSRLTASPVRGEEDGEVAGASGWARFRD